MGLPKSIPYHSKIPSSSRCKTATARDFSILEQKYKRGFISEVLKQKLILSREGEKWEEVSLSDVADGFEYGMNAAATSFDGEHKYIRMMLSRLVDTFFSRTSWTMLLYAENHSISVA